VILLALLIEFFHIFIDDCTVRDAPADTKAKGLIASATANESNQPIAELQ